MGVPGSAVTEGADFGAPRGKGRAPWTAWSQGTWTVSAVSCADVSCLSHRPAGGRLLGSSAERGEKA